MLSDYNEYIDNLNNALKGISQASIHNLYLAIKKSIESGSPIYLYGNGGSLANAAHISGDYTKTFALLGFKVKIFSPGSDSCFVSAAANDIDYSQAYEMHASSFTDRSSLVIFLSGSGNSLNLIKAFHASTRNEACIYCISGYDGGALKKMTTNHIHLPIHDMEIVEDMQIILFHYLKQKLVTELASRTPYESTYSLSKYVKRVSSGEIA